MPLDGKTCTLLAADDDLVLGDQLADILEAHRSLEHLDAVHFRHRVDQVRSGDRTPDAAGHPLDPDQVVQEQGDDVVGLDEAAVAVHDAEAVRVAVGRDPQADLGVLLHQLDEVLDVLLGGLRREAAEIRVALRIHQHHLDPVGLERFGQIAAGRAVERVHGNGPQLGDGGKVHLLGQVVQVLVHRVDLFQKPLFHGLIDGALAVADLAGHLVGAPLDVVGGLRQRRAARGGGELDAVVLGGVVARGEVDAAGGAAPQDLEGDHRGGGIAHAEEGLDPGPGQDASRLAGEGLAHEAGVVPHDDPLVGLSGSLDVVGDRLGHDLYVFKDEILTHDAAPA